MPDNDGFCQQHHMMVSMAEQVNAMHTALLGDPSSDKACGLRAEVARHTAAISIATRVLWMMVSAAVVAIVALVIKSVAWVA